MIDTKFAIEQLLIGEAPVMERLRRMILQVAPTGLPVLIQGPTGSGKELVARALHLASRRTGELVAFNVCALAESMFEDALFGHVKGAFTGATGDVPGFLAEANGGTVFLDEINTLSLLMQAKLLRAIDTGVFRPVGAARNRRSDFRVIAATNDDIVDAVAAGRFREDLFHRLGGLTLQVPSLADRSGDISKLVAHFARQSSNGNRVVFGEDAIDRLRHHHWPGNVRELMHVLARSSILAGGDVVTRRDVDLALCTPSTRDLLSEREADAREQLLSLLKKHEWDTARIAEEMAVDRATVYRRMHRLGLMPPPRRRSGSASPAKGEGLPPAP